MGRRVSYSGQSLSILQSSSNDVYIDKGRCFTLCTEKWRDYYKTLYDVVMNCKSMTMSKQQPCHSNPTKTHIQKNSRKVQEEELEVWVEEIEYCKTKKPREKLQ